MPSGSFAHPTSRTNRGKSRTEDRHHHWTNLPRAEHRSSNRHRGSATCSSIDRLGGDDRLVSTALAATLGGAARRPAHRRPALPVHGRVARRPGGAFVVLAARPLPGGPGRAGNTGTAVGRRAARPADRRPDDPRDRRPAQLRGDPLVVGPPRGLLLLHELRAAALHVRRPFRDDRRAVGDRGDVHGRGLGLRLHLHGGPGHLARVVHRRHRTRMPRGPGSRCSSCRSRT